MFQSAGCRVRGGGFGRAGRCLMAGAVALLLLGCAPSAMRSSTPAPLGSTVARPSVSGVSTVSSPYPIPVLLDMSGLVSEQHHSDIKRSLNAVAAYVNAYKGGIAGRQVEFRFYDAGEDPVRAETVWKNAMAELKPVSVVVTDSMAGEAVKALAERQRIPVLVPAGTGKLLYPPGWVFTISPDYAETALAFFGWAQNGWKEQRSMRVAFLTADSEFARSALRAIPEIRKMHGVEVVASEHCALVTVDIVSQLARIRDAQPDFVYITHQQSVIALSMSVADELGMEERTSFVTGVPVGLGSIAKGVGVAAEGLLQVVQVPMAVDEPGSDKRMIDTYREFDLHASSEPMSAGWALGYTTGRVLLDALERAVQLAGWEFLSGETVYNVLDNGQFEIGGLPEPLSYSTNRHSGLRFARVLAQRNGEQVVISDWIAVQSLPMK